MSKRKILALLLAVAMMCSLFVSPALAAESEGEPVAISDTVAPTFTDIDGHWAKDAIMRWAEAGIAKGDGDGTVNPGRNLKRAELATILARLLGLKEAAPADTFNDVAADAWYADAVLKCAKAGIMQGVGEGKADPESPVDREQAIVMIGRALGVKPAAGHSLDRFADKDSVSDWAAPYMVVLTSMDILSGIPAENDTVVVAPQVNIDRASTFTLLDKAIAQFITAPCTVTVDDANKFVVINSAAEEAGVVTVTGTTAGVVVGAGTTDAVTLDKATVGTVKVDAPVDVTVSRGSSVTNLDANAAADVTNNGVVTNLNTNADDVTFDGNKPSTVTTAEDVKPATDSKGNEVTEAPTTSGGSTGGNTGKPSAKKADVVGAPSVDQKAGGFGENVTDSATTAEGTVKTAATEETPVEYDVKITARGVKNHTNAAATPVDAHWVGFGIPAVAGNTYWDGNQEIESAANRTITVGEKTYNTIYFDDNDQKTTKVITVKNDDKETAIYNVTFDVTFWSVADADVKILATEADTAAVIAALEAMEDSEGKTHPWAHKFAKGLGLNATVNGNAIALDGETTLAKLESTYLGTEGCDGYLTYALQVTDTAIADFKHGESSNIKDELGLDGATVVVNQKIYKGTDKSFASDAAITLELLDAADRVQDEITVTVDASAVTIEGLKKATFKDGDKVVATLMDAASVTAPAAPASTEDVYYTGNWVSGETTVAAGNTYAFVGEAKEITFTAEKKDVTDQTVAVRPAVGPAGETADFNYEAAYVKAGIEGTTAVVIDGKKMLEENAVATELLHTVNGKQYVFYGLQFTKPEGATNVVVAETVADLDSSNDTYVLTQESDDVFKGEYINYINVSQALENGKVVLCGEGPATFNYAFKWLKDGEVVAVTKVTVTRTTTIPTFKLTFKNGTETVAAVDVAYNTAIAEADIPAVPAKAGYTGVWKDFDKTAKVTADAEIAVEYTAIEYTVKGLGTDETWTVEGKKGENDTVTLTLPEVPAKAGWVGLGWQILEQCEATDEGAVEDSSWTGHYAHWVDFKATSIKAEDIHKYAVGQEGNCIHFQPVYACDAQVVAVEDTSDWSAWEGYPTATEGVTNPFGTVTLAEEDDQGVTKVTGTLNLITGFTGFNSTVSREQSGYYAAIEIKAPQGATSLDGFNADNAVIRVENEFSANPVKVHKLTGVNDTLMLLIHVADAPAEGAAAVVGAEQIKIFANWKGLTAEENGVPAGSFACTLDFTGVTLKAAPATSGTGTGGGSTAADQEQATTSSVETAGDVIVDAVLPSDDEVAEIPVFD